MYFIHLGNSSDNDCVEVIKKENESDADEEKAKEEPKTADADKEGDVEMKEADDAEKPSPSTKSDVETTKEKETPANGLKHICFSVSSPTFVLK